MIPGRGARLDRRGHRRAHRGFERGQHVGLGVEGIGGDARPCVQLRAPSPMRIPAATVVLRFGHAAFELRADLEQHQIVEAARLIALRRCEQRRQHARAQRIEIGGDRIFQLARIVAAAEQFGLRARDEGEIDRLVEAARGQRAAHDARAALRRRQRRLARPRCGASAATDGTLSRPWMRTTSSTRSALPTTSLRQDGGVTFSDRAVFDREAEARQDAR